MLVLHKIHSLHLRICLAILTALAVAGCSSLSRRTSPRFVPTPTSEPETVLVSPLPVTVVPELASPLPSPFPSSSVVVGQVLDLSTKKPIPHTPVYLGRVLRTPAGVGIFALESTTPLRGKTDADGHFVIRDVPPGEYVIAVGEIGGLRLPSMVMASSTEVKSFSVQPGKVTYLGTIQVSYQDR